MFTSASTSCGSGKYSKYYMLPGPGEQGYDPDLALKARRFDRQFHTFNAAPMGIGTDVNVPLKNAAERKLINDFINKDDSWDFAKFSGGKTYMDVIDSWNKTAGLYAGVGIAADAFRYAVLRDQNADCAEIDVARKHLIAALDTMHIAFEIGGKPGVVARGLFKKDLPGSTADIKPLPLTDKNGHPLPLVKDNGQWRDDFSGKHPDYKWEDSISRDMMLGYAMASAAAAEVMRGDDSFPQSVKTRLAADASAICAAMRKRTKYGYDLEFPDADGRTTLYGHLNENNLDGKYIPGLKNGFYAVMALGIYSGFAYAANDPEADAYLYNVLIRKRRLHMIMLDHMKFVDLGIGSNFSNYNMAFTAAWLAMRYVNDDAALSAIRNAIDTQLYNRRGETRQPIEMKQSLFDFIFSASKTRGTAYSAPDGNPDAPSLDRGIETLYSYPSPPFWDYPRLNCDESELKSCDCTLDDGTKVKIICKAGMEENILIGVEGAVLAGAGWKNEIVADKPIPMRVRPPSNYYWRSNPYSPNGGGSGASMNSSVDFRVAYWLARWTAVPK